MSPKISLFIDSQDFLSPTVTDSQVVELMLMLQARQHRFRYVNVVGVRYYLRHRLKIRARRRELESRLQDRVVLVLTLKPGNALGRTMARCLLAVYIFMRAGTRGPVFVHARGHGAAQLVLPLKRLFRRMAVLFDVRGDVLSEFLFTAGESPGVADARETRRIASALAEKERAALRVADEISCVSEKLLQNLLQRHGISRRENFHVFPSAADADRIRPDVELRTAVRRRLGIAGRTVMLYSGGIGRWHETDRTLDAFSAFIALRPGAFFLFLTPYVREAESAFAGRNVPPADYRIASVAHSAMNEYQNAADCGILLRRPNPLNLAACPTKFPEYMLAGLPVLISDGIGDCSDFVREHAAGVVLRDLGSDTELRDCLSTLITATYRRDAIRAAALRTFSKQSYLDEYERMLRAHAS